ncbi:hypothetical protein HDU89_002173 [Geranomyces variabilis]|nr:hypothetical protein HDU89_002173 [Geranomyces variabilis]
MPQSLFTRYTQHASPSQARDLRHAIGSALVAEVDELHFEADALIEITKDYQDATTQISAEARSEPIRRETFQRAALVAKIKTLLQKLGSNAHSESSLVRYLFSEEQRDKHRADCAALLAALPVPSARDMRQASLPPRLGCDRLRSLILEERARLNAVIDGMRAALECEHEFRARLDLVHNQSMPSLSDLKQFAQELEVELEMKAREEKISAMIATTTSSSALKRSENTDNHAAALIRRRISLPPKPPSANTDDDLANILQDFTLIDAPLTRPSSVQISSRLGSALLKPAGTLRRQTPPTGGPPQGIRVRRIVRHAAAQTPPRVPRPPPAAVARQRSMVPEATVHQRSFNFAVDSNDDSGEEDSLEEDENDEDSADELQEYLSSLAKKKLTAASVAATSARPEMPSQPSPRAAASGYLKRLPTAPASPALHRIPTLGSPSPAPVPAAAASAVLRLPPYTRPKELNALPVKDNGGDSSSDESLGSDFESFLRSPTKRSVVQVTDPVEQSPTRSRASTPSPPVPPSFALPTKSTTTAFAVADNSGPSAAVYTPRSSKSTYDHVARASAPSPALSTTIRDEEPATRASLVRTPDYPPAATPPSTRAAQPQNHASPADHIAARLSPSPIRSGLSTPKRFRSAESLSHTRFPYRRASLSPTRHSRSSSFSSSVSPLHQQHHHASRPGAGPGPPSLRHSVAGSAPRSPSRLSVAHTFAAPITSADPAIEKVSQAKSQPAPPAGPTNQQIPPPSAFPSPGTYSAPAAHPAPPAQHPAPYPAAYGYPPYPYLYPPPLAAWGPGPAQYHHVCTCKSSSRSSADSESHENRSSTPSQREKEKRPSRSKHRRQRRRAPSPPTKTDAEKPHSRTESHDHHRSRQHHHHRRHRRRSHHRRRDDSPLAPPEPPPGADIDPNLALLHTLMSGHLAYVKAFVASHFAAADCVEFRRKRYMTLADTKKFIKENARYPMSFAEAVRKVDEEQLGLQS